MLKNMNSGLALHNASYEIIQILLMSSTGKWQRLQPWSARSKRQDEDDYGDEPLIETNKSKSVQRCSGNESIHPDKMLEHNATLPDALKIEWSTPHSESTESCGECYAPWKVLQTATGQYGEMSQNLKTMWRRSIVKRKLGVYPTTNCETKST